MSKPDRKPKYPLVLVNWEDSAAEGKWKEASEYKTRMPLMMQSVGYKLLDDKKRLILLQSICHENDVVSDSITIPRGCVKSIRKLKQ